MHLNVFAAILLAGSILTFLVALLVFKRLGGVVRWWGYVMSGISLWAFSYGIELTTATLQHMLWCIYVEYIAIAFLPAVWMVFVIRFVGYGQWLTKYTLGFLFLIPCCTLVFVWLNHWLHWHYSQVSVDASGPFPLLNIQAGWWYYVHATFFYAMLLAGIVLLIFRFRNANSIYKKQTYIIVWSAIIPWIINALYLQKYRPFEHIDLTPYAFVVSALLIGVGLLRFDLFNIIPIAKELVFNAIEDCVIVIGNNYQVADFNAACKQEKAFGSTITHGTHIDVLFIDYPSLLDVLKNDGLIHNNQEIVIQIKDQLFDVSVNKLIDAKTEISGCILLLRNITDKRKVQEQLKAQAAELAELNKLKDKIFSIIAHDLRTPLINFTEILNMLSAGILTKEEFEAVLPDMQKDIEYTTGFMENLLHWSKSQLQGQVIKAELFAIDLVVQQAILLLQSNAKSKQITLINQVNQELLVYADKNMIQLVLRNLLSNAVKFCIAGNTVKITAITQNEYVKICVSDNGRGIQPEVLQKLFSNESISTKGSKDEIGTGLGLLLCKEFVEKNQGTISVQSTWGAGSVFCFTLPVANARK